jgi:large subunit ribosomal protein L6
MSRIGKKPVEFPSGVKIAVKDRLITVEKGAAKLSFTHRPEVAVKVDDGARKVTVTRADDSREAKAMHGVTRTLIANMIEGVTKGYQRELEINGVGWGATLKGKTLSLSVGFAQPRIVEIPQGVDLQINATRLVIKGIDKQKVGQVAAEIRSQRKPEPYKGKGIKYVEEVIQRKQGKQFAGG